jgi:Mrp family chromosome partitioning ATPase
MINLSEAPRRAVGERRSDQNSVDGASSQNGDSSPGVTKQLASVLAEISAPSSEEASAAVEPTIENILPLSNGLAGQVVESNPGLSAELKSSNGFRPLTLPDQVESRLVFQTDPHGLAAEQFRVLRQALKREFPKNTVLMITSPAMGDGKTLTSINLCSCLGGHGDSTLLIELDLRLPNARKTLGGVAAAPPGVEDVLAGKAEPARAIHSINELSFHAAMVANAPSDPAQLLSGPGVKQLLAWAREHFRWIVLDVPPVLPAADVAELVPFADAVLLVIRARSTPRELSSRAFELVGKRLHAVILNEATIESSPHYSYLRGYNLGAGA